MGLALGGEPASKRSQAAGVTVSLLVEWHTAKLSLFSAHLSPRSKIAAIHTPHELALVGLAWVGLQVSHAHAGAVIGPKGATLAALRASTGCRCAVEAQALPPDGERCVTVSGSSAQAVSDGVDGVLAALFASENPPSAATVLVPLTAVGTLIGKAGSTINQMRAASGCSIQVPHFSELCLSLYLACSLPFCPG